MPLKKTNLAPLQIDGSQFSQMLLSDWRAQTGTGQDLRSVFVHPAQLLILCIHFLSEGLQIEEFVVLFSPRSFIFVQHFLAAP